VRRLRWAAHDFFLFGEGNTHCSKYATTFLLFVFRSQRYAESVAVGIGDGKAMRFFLSIASKWIHIFEGQLQRFAIIDSAASAQLLSPISYVIIGRKTLTPTIFHHQFPTNPTAARQFFSRKTLQLLQQQLLQHLPNLEISDHSAFKALNCDRYVEKHFIAICLRSL